MENKFSVNPRVLKFLGAFLFAFLFFFTGYLIGHRNLVFEDNYRPVIVNKELAKPRSVDFGIFWQAWDLVNTKFVSAVDPQKMVYGAISGMVQSLNDPFSSFMEPDATKSFFQDLSGEIEGIGAEVSLKDSRITIVSPLSDSPAEKAGLKPNDQVFKINDTSTDGMTVEEAVSRIRGKAGSEVTISIMRDGFDSPQDFKIRRQKIAIKSVKWEIKDNNIAYIKISQFGDDTTQLMKQAASEIADKKPKSIVIDLRNNPGGYLDSAIDITSLFIGKGVVVKEKFKDGHIEEHRTTLDPILKDYKLVILTNNGSASASEIFAGALKDYGRAKLIGEKTFGKGSVQELENLPGGATLRITVAKWLTPKDNVIDKVGIEPDEKVNLTDENIKAGQDPQLNRALEVANN